MLEIEIEIQIEIPIEIEHARNQSSELQDIPQLAMTIKAYSSGMLPGRKVVSIDREYTVPLADIK